MVFIKQMKATIQEDREKNGVHQQMNTTIQEGRGKNGVHQADESHNPRRPRKKWCSPSK
jgi:hypothetical protein